jgi:hypothetical protein
LRRSGSPRIRLVTDFSPRVFQHRRAVGSVSTGRRAVRTDRSEMQG